MSKWSIQRPEDVVVVGGFDPRGSYSTAHRMNWNTAAQCFEFDTKPGFQTAEMIHLFEVISSAMLMYRLCCLFPEVHVDTEENVDRYRPAWTDTIWHRQTLNPALNPKN